MRPRPPRPTSSHPLGTRGNEIAVLWAPGGGSPTMTTMEGTLEGSCPVCNQGDLISITMTVSGSDLSFTTCHMCEAKWWYRDGEAVRLQSVIGNVLTQRP